MPPAPTSKTDKSPVNEARKSIAMMETQKMDKTMPKNAASKEFMQAFEKGSGKPGKRWVLIVDDDATIRRVVTRSMTAVDKELKVHEAENGRHALDTLRAIRQSAGTDPVLIVTDLQMPVMDGWDFVNELWKECEKKGQPAGIPVIVLSASSGEKGFFGSTSIHGGKCPYTPLVAIAKEDCVKPMKYDSQGEKGLAAWLKHFLD